jgi:hypothetical protein
MLTPAMSCLLVFTSPLIYYRWCRYNRDKLSPVSLTQLITAVTMTPPINNRRDNNIGNNLSPMSNGDENNISLPTSQCEHHVKK